MIVQKKKRVVYIVRLATYIYSLKQVKDMGLPGCFHFEKDEY